ncbi:hypothetical protein ACHAXM_000968 [Skeletonema potamos]
MEELAAKLSKTIILDGDEDKNVAAPTLPRIRDVKSFDEHIEMICESLSRTLTSKQLEATYQKCLCIDLKRAGIKVLGEEVKIKLQYKGEEVATRRADIVLQTPSDKQWIVLELKAVSILTSEHMKQLQFYMYHFDIEIGYLINFPHDTGFPDLPSTAMYRQTIMSGQTEMLSDRNTRARTANAQVQIIKVERIITDDDCSAPAPYASLSQSAQNMGNFIVPIARTTGKPCKLCTERQSYCQYHIRRADTINPKLFGPPPTPRSSVSTDVTYFTKEDHKA